jgi:hypothetical protein
MLTRTLILIGLFAAQAAAQTPSVPAKAPVARFLDPPGLPAVTIEVGVWDSTGIAYVEYLSVQRQPHALGYLTLDVPWGAETERNEVVRVVANDGTERTITIHLERPAALRAVATQAEFDDALATMTNGGVISLAPHQTWLLRDVPAASARWIWITSPEGAAFVVGAGSGITRIHADHLGFVGCTLDLPSIGAFSIDSNDEIAFVDCDLVGKEGIRWVPAVIGGDAGAGQKFYFERCHIVGRTTYGFTDAYLVDRCIIDSFRGDAFQHSLNITRCRIDEVYDSGDGHHKDLLQDFVDVENQLISDVQLLGIAVGLQDDFDEDNFRIGQYDARIDAVRDRYVKANSVIRRVQVLRHDTISPPQSQQWGTQSNCGIIDCAFLQGISWRGSASNTNQFTALNGYTVDGLLCGLASSIEITGERFGTGGFGPGVTWNNVGVTESKWANNGFVGVTEAYPYTDALAYLGIEPPLSPDSAPPDVTPVLVYDIRFDITTQGVAAGDPGWLEPDGLISGADLQAFTNLWHTQDQRADLTTQGASLSDPAYMVPDGFVTGADIAVYVNYWHINNGAAAL